MTKRANSTQPARTPAIIAWLEDMKKKQAADKSIINKAIKKKKSKKIDTPKEAFEGCIEYRIKNGFNETDSRKMLFEIIKEHGRVEDNVARTLQYEVFASYKMSLLAAPLLIAGFFKEKEQ